MVDDSDALFRVPLADFVRDRDALAARLKAGGDKAGAAAVKAIRRPGVAAWAANQVVWRTPDAWERLQTAATALRRGHESGASADVLRQASRAQREALAACEARAAAFLVEHGHAATPAVLQKAAATLQALCYGAGAATPGRLVEELSPVGFDAVAGLSLPPASGGEPPPAPPSVAEAAAGAAMPGRVPDETDETDAAPRRAEEAARLARARAGAREREAIARQALDAARDRAEECDRRCAALEQDLAEARAEADDARRALAAAQAEAQAAARALEEGPGEEGAGLD
ncbi:MAG: hypothetical protein U0599_30520 [Vicinamibacteria bacterium]